MKKMFELRRKIELARLELDKALLQNDKFESCYEKSTELDRLIEEYLERNEKICT
ncbi:MAG: Spo0E family sporulation regulatory protein-aspartic acid phosphatase [Clostridiales bacterium]|nr:Spo0E family sporulation regulatory protein-aspartic acid phosphatase [Clostridiales bacterium]